jgi:hypothetical protein
LTAIARSGGISAPKAAAAQSPIAKANQPLGQERTIIRTFLVFGRIFSWFLFLIRILSLIVYEKEPAGAFGALLAELPKVAGKR